MEGYSGDTSSESKEDTKDKKTGKAAGLGGRTFEFVKKTDAAEKIADASSIWEKLIPKEKPDTSESKSAKAEQPDSAEEAIDTSVEILTDGEKAEVAKDYAQEKRAELEGGRNNAEEPAEAAAREATIEYLQQVEKDAEAVPLEPIEDVAAQPEEIVGSPAEDVTNDSAENLPEAVPEGPAEFAHDEAVELNRLVDGAEELAATTSPTPLAGGSSMPPTSPKSPTMPPPIGRGPSGAGFNTAPAVGFNPNIAPVTIENHYHDSNEGAYFLAGGILGYMLGRRRGRIKTERRMKAVSKKLEKQIKDTRDKIKQQEVLIGEQTRNRYNETHSARGAETTAARAINTVPRAETITDLTRSEVKQSTPEQTAAAERVQHLQHHEVLAIAEKVTIDGTSLRKIYEAKQITEPGLRRLTREYLRGGDLRAALQHELQVKEMQYERDPQMRDRLAASYAGVDAASPQASSAAMANLLAQGRQAPASSANNDTQQGSDDTGTPKNKGKQILISAWAVLIVILVIVVVVLAAR